MSWLDIVIIAILAISIVYSVIKGFVREVFFFLGIILGALAALRGYNYGAVFFKDAIGNPTLALVVTFLVIMAVVFLVIKIIGWSIGKAFQRARLTALDRALGALFGFLKGAVIISVLLLLLVGFAKHGKEYVTGSRLSPYFLKSAKVVSKALPENIRDGLHEAYKNLQDPERLKLLEEALKGIGGKKGR